MELLKKNQAVKLRFVIGFGFAISLVLAYPYLFKFIHKDICLDEGGSWNDLSESCEII